MYVAGLCQFPTNRMQCFFTSNARTVLRRNSFQFLYACRQVVVRKDRQFQTLNLYRARVNQHQYSSVRVWWVCWVACRYLAAFWQIRSRVLVPTVTVWARKDEHPRRQPEVSIATTGVLVIDPPFIFFKTEVSCTSNKILLNKSITNSTRTTRIFCLAKAWKQSK